MGELKSLHRRCWPWRRFSMSQQCLLQNKRRLFPSSARRKESLSLPRRVLESRLWQLSPEETHDCHCQWPCIGSTVVHSPASSDIFRRQWFPRDQEDLSAAHRAAPKSRKPAGGPSTTPKLKWNLPGMLQYAGKFWTARHCKLQHRRCPSFWQCPSPS